MIHHIGQKLLAPIFIARIFAGKPIFAAQQRHDRSADPTPAGLFLSPDRGHGPDLDTVANFQSGG